MSHRSAAVARHSHSPSSPRSGAASARTQEAAAVIALPTRRGRTDYTFGHAGQQLRIGPIAFWIVVGTLVIMAVWTIGTATYFAFRDDVLTRLIRRQADMQSAYEDRIAEMRAQVDRVTSRQLLDQEQVEQKLADIQRRQTKLESRSAELSNLIDPATTGSIRRPPRRLAPSGGHATGIPKPSPINDLMEFAEPAQHDAQLESRIAPGAGGPHAQITTAGLNGALSHLRSSLDLVESRQDAALRTMEGHYEAAAGRMRGVLAGLGVEVGNPTHAQSSRAGMGGPLVPVDLTEASGFQRQIYRINVARSDVDRLTNTLRTVPVRRPLPGELDMTSGFGVRVDPFLGVPAMHTGLDFRAAVGEPVRATAAGTVTIATWTGGYGKMVEISHGKGLATRYGHLSEILVKPGQSVHAGQIVGRVGSTGRSTGPHLHYETRVDGEAVDPHKFLQAGMRLGLGS